MDIYDQATEKEIQERELAISAARYKSVSLPPLCACYNCEEPISDGLLFCDHFCRDDWQKRNPAK